MCIEQRAMSLEGGKEHTQKKKFAQIWKADVSMKDAGQNQALLLSISFTAGVNSQRRYPSSFSL